LGRRGTGAPVTALFGQFVVLGRPFVAVIGALVVLAQVYRFYRCHVTTGRYRRWTTHMMLELQVMYALLYAFAVVLFVLFAMVLLLSTAVGAAPVVGDSIARTAWLAVVVVTGVAVKLAFEWSRVRGERQQDVAADSFTANFVPTPPERTDGAHEPAPDRTSRSTDP
jgi:hypothetical protein